MGLRVGKVERTTALADYITSVIALYIAAACTFLSMGIYS